MDAPSAFFCSVVQSREVLDVAVAPGCVEVRSPVRARVRAPTEQGEELVYRDIPDELRGLIEPVVADHGCELVDAETLVGARSGLLRITIDRLEGDGRVPVESCARISREIEAQLNAADVMSGVYNLEVSSPGLDRMLAREKDFEAACGQDVKLKTRRPVDGRRRFQGRLLEFRAREVVLLIDGQVPWQVLDGDIATGGIQ